MPVQEFRRRRLGLEVTDEWDTRPFRNYVQQRIVKDFAEATYDDIESGDEKQPEPLHTRLYPVELIALIRAATLTKTPDEAYENSFDYLYQIIEEATNVTNNGPYSAFRDQWIDRWGGLITDFDQGNHVLIILAQVYNFQLDDEDEEEIQRELDDYITNNVGGNLRYWMIAEMLLDADAQPNTTDWHDGATGPDPGEQSKWRDLAVNMLRDVGDHQDQVMEWYSNFRQFVTLVMDAFAYSRFDFKDKLIRAQTFDFMIRVRRGAAEAAERRGRGAQQFPFVLIVVVLAVLAFLLIY
jgi:hypothetical protein